MTVRADVTFTCDDCGTTLTVVVTTFDRHAESRARELAVGWAGPVASLTDRDRCPACRATYWQARQDARSEAQKLHDQLRDLRDASESEKIPIWKRLFELLDGPDPDGFRAAAALCMTLQGSSLWPAFVERVRLRLADAKPGSQYWGLRRELRRVGEDV